MRPVLLLPLVEGVSRQRRFALPAVVSVDSQTLSGEHLGYLATFGGTGASGRCFSAGEGCAAYHAPSGAAVLGPHGCSFVEKAVRAQQAGATCMVVVSDTEVPLAMGQNDSRAEGLTLTAVSVSAKFGQALLQASETDTDTTIHISKYAASLWDSAQIAMTILATLLVFAGAKLAALDVVPGVAGSSATELPPEPRPQDGLEDSGDGSEGSGDDAFELPDSLEMTGLPAAFGFCAFASLSLLVMFYFKEHLVFGVTAGFCFGCALCISDLGRRLLPSCLGRWVQRGLILPLLGPVTVAELASLPLALLLVACFLLYRGSHFGFIFQDVLGMAFLLCFQLHAKFTDLRSACYFLCIMFCYDFFWVFLSPLLFDKSVMANVAGGDGDGAGGDASEQLPMVLLLPMFNDPFGGEEMLGFGDVALPGLLVSYTLRQDLLRGRTSGGYFGPCLLGYLIGASLTQVVMSTFQTAQPALIYIVPCTLGTTVLLAWRRRELSALWKGSKPGDIEEPLLPDH